MLWRMLRLFAMLQVPQPYFNEPGYESSIGTPEGEEQSFEYNTVIREATLKYSILGATADATLADLPLYSAR